MIKIMMNIMAMLTLLYVPHTMYSLLMTREWIDPNVVLMTSTGSRVLLSHLVTIL